MVIFQFKEDPFNANGQSNDKVYHEALLLTKVLQNKPQVKEVNNIYYDLYYIFIKNRNEKEMVEDSIDFDNEELYVNIIMPNYIIGRDHDTLLRWNKNEISHHYFRTFHTIRKETQNEK